VTDFHIGLRASIVVKLDEAPRGGAIGLLAPRFFRLEDGIRGAVISGNRVVTAKPAPEIT